MAGGVSGGGGGERLAVLCVCVYSFSLRTTEMFRSSLPPCAQTREEEGCEERKRRAGHLSWLQ